MGIGLSLGRLGGSRYKRGFPYNIGFPYSLNDKLLADWDAYYGVTVTGSGVSSWVDRKSGYAVVQATDASRPPYSATGFNGVPCLTFNGTSQNLRMAPHPFPLDDGNFEIWAVLANVQPSDAGNRFAVQFSGTASLVRQASNSLNAVAGGAISGGGTLSTNSRHLGRAVIQTGFVTGYMDGVSGGGPTVSNPAITGDAMAIGSANTGAAAFWNGSMHRVLITSLLSADEATAMNALLLPLRML